MVITCTVYIDTPLRKAVALFSDAGNLGKWQEGFQSFTTVSGEPGKTGSVAKITFSNRGHAIELTETILISELPHEFKALYEHKHGSNTTTSSFTEVEPGKTRFDMSIEPVKTIGFFPRFMMWLMPGMIKKPTEEWLKNFKSLAETGTGIK
jgi:hypothetical protein